MAALRSVFPIFLVVPLDLGDEGRDNRSPQLECKLKKAAYTFLRALILLIAAAALGLLVNWIRSGGIPLVAGEPYEIYKDCPEISKEATAVKMAHLEADLSPFRLIDARPTNDFLSAHVPGARSLPYDPIRPMDKELIDGLRALGPNRLLVYGDKEIDSGRLMAGELSSAGLLGVRYIEGGFEAWLGAGRSTETGGQP